LRSHNIPAAPKRKQTIRWKDFIRAHLAVLAATDFFTVEVLTLRGLKTYYVLFFIHLESRKVYVAGITRHPDQEWMEQMARNVTMEDAGFLIQKRYLLHDRDSKYCASFREVIEAGGVKPLALPPRSPNLNAYAERWIRSVREECLTKLILLGEGSLRLALKHYETHYHEERKSPRQRQPTAVSVTSSSSPWRTEQDTMSGSAGRSAEILCAAGGMSRESEHPIQTAGFWIFGLISMVLAVLKWTVAPHWSWWRVMLPFLAYLSHNALYILTALLCFRWLKHEEEESTTAAEHARNNYNIPRLF